MPTTPMSERSIFMAALDRDGPLERAAFLRDACGGDAALRGRVEALLRSHEQAGSFLGAPAVAELTVAAAALAPAPADGPGAQVGPYRLLEQIGEGGMGVVFLAEQTRPVRRQVALKVIKAGMDTKQVVARFEAERQALALMDHPNIAKVLDAGVTETGRPFFVMELVKGVPITRYCDEHRLTPRDRLGLFVQVCRAVQHAHQKGVIHRDLKPSNVLVAPYDGKPVPKVIDFGVAKAAGGRLTEATLVTGSGAVVGTPEYMSPEQAELNQLDVDTRSDIYSLGVILYELVTGSTPLDRARLRQAALVEVLRVIREEEPPRPSTRLSTAEKLPSIAAQRGLEPRKLSGLVRGELDWIVMKALDKDRSRRYETANGLARDVERYLADEAVLACPPSAAYRFRKLARRHKALLATAAAFAALLALGAAVSTWQAVRATRAEGVARVQRDAAAGAERRAVAQAALAARERDKARDAERRARRHEARARDQEAQARVEVAVVEAVVRFLEDDLLGQADVARQAAPGVRPDRDVTLRTALDRAAARVGDRFGGQPLIEAGVRQTIGNTYMALGAYEAARPHLERALALRARKLGPGHRGTLLSRNALAMLHVYAGDYAKAEPMLAETLAAGERAQGPDHPDTLMLVNNLALVYEKTYRFAEACPLYERALAGLRRAQGPEHDETLTALNNLAGTYRKMGRLDEAEPLMAEALAGCRRALGDEHPHTIMTASHLGWLYSDMGRYDEAEGLLEQATADARRVMGPEHPMTLTSEGNLGLLYYRSGRHDDAAAAFEKNLASTRRVLGRDHPGTLQSQRNLADAYERLGRHGDAEALFVEALGLERRRHGAGSVQVGAALADLAENLLAQGRHADAEPILRECLAVCEARRPEAPVRFWVQSMLGESLAGQGQYAGAEPLLLAGYAGLKRTLTPPPGAKEVRLPENMGRWRPVALDRLVSLYERWDKPEQAARWRKERADPAGPAGEPAREPAGEPS